MIHLNLKQAGQLPEIAIYAIQLLVRENRE